MIGGKFFCLGFVLVNFLLCVSHSVCTTRFFARVHLLAAELVDRMEEDFEMNKRRPKTLVVYCRHLSANYRGSCAMPPRPSNYVAKTILSPTDVLVWKSALVRYLSLARYPVLCSSLVILIAQTGREYEPHITWVSEPVAVLPSFPRSQQLPRPHHHRQ